MVKKNTDPCHSFYAITQMKKDKIQKEQGGRKKERHKKEKRNKEKEKRKKRKDASLIIKIYLTFTGVWMRKHCLKVFRPHRENDFVSCKHSSITN